MQSKAILIILLLYAIGTMLYASPASAEGIAISTEPSILRVQAKPGVSVDLPVTVTNNADTPITLSLSYRQFRASDTSNGQVTYVLPDEGEKKILNGTSIWEDGSPIPSLSLAAKQKKVVSIHIVVLPDTPERDFYFSTILSTDSTPLPSTNLDTQNTFLQLHGAVAINILLSVGAADIPNIGIDAFSAPGFLEHGPVLFTVGIANKGTHLIRPRATIAITNMFGQKVGKMNLDQVTILAKSTRFVPAKGYISQDNQGEFSTRALWPEQILFGPYTATLHVEDESGSKEVEKTIQFVAVPYNRLGAVFLAAVLVTVIILQVKRRLNS